MRLSFLGLALAAGLASGTSAPSPASPAARREVRLHYTAQDREVGRYQYVPVHVPAGTTRLTVGYAYDKAGGANVVDLGLYDVAGRRIGTLVRAHQPAGAQRLDWVRGELHPGVYFTLLRLDDRPLARALIVVR